jgi:ribonuclease R
MERNSMRIERDADDVCAGFLLQRELFERGPASAFEGEVSGVISAGAFIQFRGEHSDAYEGFFPGRRMSGERFEINDVESALVGMKTGRRVGIGDAIEIKVEAVEAARGRVDLIGAENATRRPKPGASKGSGRTGKPSGRASGKPRGKKSSQARSKKTPNKGKPRK